MSWLDHLPSHERAKIRAKIRSPEEYERLREKVKGPEDLEKEMEWNEAMAELSFALESEPRLKEALRNQVHEDLKEKGMDAILEERTMSPDMRSLIENGQFKVSIQSHPVTHKEQLMVLPEGNVTDRIPVQQSVSEHYVAQFVQNL